MRTIFMTALAALALTTAAEAAPARQFKHSDGGKHSPVGAGHSVSSKLRLSNNGRLDVKLTIVNRVALTGFCARARYYLLDAEGNVLRDFGSPQMCVDGDVVPWGRSRRTETLRFRVPDGEIGKVAKIAVVHTPGSKNPLELLRKNLKAAVGVFEIAAGAFGS